MKEAVCQWAADPFVEEDEHCGHLDALVGEPIRVRAAFTREEAVSAELAHVIAQLGQRIRVCGERKGFDDGSVHLGGPPATELRPAVEQDFHQAKHARVVDFDAGRLRMAVDNRFGEAFEHGEVHVHVEEIGFDAGEAIRDGDEFLAQRGQLLEPFVQPEIFEPIDAHFDTEERPELLVCAGDQTLAVDAQHVVPVVELLEHRVEFAPKSSMFADAEDLRDDVGRQPVDAELTRALEELVDRKVAAEDEVPTILDLIQGIGPAKVDGRTVLLGKLRAEHQRPVVEPFLNHGRIEPIGRRLQGLDVRGPQERVVPCDSGSHDA